MKKKQSIVTFKVNEDFLAVIRDIPNRSEFIRAAILQALDNHCPLCGGTGVLTPNQKKHWETFALAHPLRECGDCHEVHLVCAQDEGPHGHAES